MMVPDNVRDVGRKADILHNHAYQTLALHTPCQNDTGHGTL